MKPQDLQDVVDCHRLVLIQLHTGVRGQTERRLSVAVQRFSRTSGKFSNVRTKPMRNFIFFVLIYYSSVSIVGQLAQSKNEEGHLVCPYHKEI